MPLWTYTRNVLHNLQNWRCVQNRPFPLTSITILITLLIVAVFLIADHFDNGPQSFGTPAVRRMKGLNFGNNNFKIHQRSHFHSNIRHFDKPCEKFPPKAIVFGVTKCGTGPLTMFLKAHPDIDNAPVRKAGKAINYFCKHYHAGISWYLNQMPCSGPNRMVVDHDPQYFRRLNVPKRLYQFNNTIKLILLVREPISRTISQFLQSRGSDRASSSDLESFVLDKSGTKVDTDNYAISASSYYIHVRRWLKFFSINQMLIIDATELANDPLKHLKKLETFLGVRSYFNSKNVYLNETRGFHCVKVYHTGGRYKCSGSNKGRVHPELSDTTYNLLKEYFDPLNEMFFKTIGKEFNWTTARREPSLSY